MAVRPLALMTQDLLDLIEADPSVGTRLAVSVVLDCLAAGMTDAEIHEQYPSLPADAARAAVAYGALLAREELHPLKPTSG